MFYWFQILALSFRSGSKHLIRMKVINCKNRRSTETRNNYLDRLKLVNKHVSCDSRGLFLFSMLMFLLGGLVVLSLTGL